LPSRTSAYQREESRALPKRALCRISSGSGELRHLVTVGRQQIGMLLGDVLLPLLGLLDISA
jgi:hypothetical protein